MAWSDYNEFIGAARGLYGLDLDEARQLYRDLKEVVGVPPDVEALLELPELVEEAVEEYREEEEEPYEEPEREVVRREMEDRYEEDVTEWDIEHPPDPMYELEYGDDDIIFEGEEVEVTAELEYEEGGR